MSLPILDKSMLNNLISCQQGSLRCYSQAKNLMLILLCLAIVIPLIMLPTVNLTDFSDWSYQGWLLGEYVKGREITAYTLKHYPVPNSLSTLIIGIGSYFMPVFVIQKAVIVFILAAWALLFYKTSDGNPVYVLLAFSLIALSSCFFNGYINFIIGCLLFYIYRLIDKEGRNSKVIVILFSLALFFSHAIPFAFFVLYTLLRHGKHYSTALIPSLLLLVWYIAGRYITYANSEQIALDNILADASIPRILAYKLYTILKLGFFQNYLNIQGISFLEQHPNVYWGLSGISSAAFIYLVFILIRFKWKTAINPVTDEAPLLFFVSLSLFLPTTLFGVVNPTERILFLYLIYLLSDSTVIRALPARKKFVFLIISLVFITYNAIALYHTTSHTRHAYIATNTNNSHDEAVYKQTQLPYFSHALYAHIKKLHCIREGDYKCHMFSSGIWISR